MRRLATPGNNVAAQRGHHRRVNEAMRKRKRMRKLKRWKPALNFALGILACLALTAAQPSFALDARYTDSGGALVADVPAKTIDPAATRIPFSASSTVTTTQP